jgi:putative DNA primase/helicase
MDKLSDADLDRLINGRGSGDNTDSEQKAADTWLTAFSKKSEEALAKRDAEKKAEPRPDDKVLIERLARKDHTEYDRMRAGLAETLGIRVGTVDDKVEAIRKTLKSADEDEPLPHWNVELWPEEVDGDALLDSIRRVIRRYIVLPIGADIAIPLWLLHAWTYAAGDISPFLVLVSPTHRCGKTSTMIILQYLTPRSEISNNITGPALFRYIEQAHPTLLIDEADSFVRGNEELRGILNSGHTKASAYVRRTVEVNGEHTTRRFSTWTPKAVATIRGLAVTLEDRAVTLMLQRKPPGIKVERLRRRDNKEFADLRSQAKRWAADNFDKLTDPDPETPEQLNDRAADNWRPLLAIAELAGGEWPKLAREAACLLSGEAHTDAMGIELLKDIRAAFGADQEIRSADLIAKLTADPERPWAEWKHGRPLSQKQLGSLLKPFCIISTTVHPPGLAHGKGYRRGDFTEAWDAYCPGQNTPLPQFGTSEACKRAHADEMGITHNFRSVQEAIPHGSKNGNLSYNHAGLHACTFRNGGNGADPSSDQEIAPGAVPAGHVCAQCGRVPPDGLEEQFPIGRELVWLHRECRRFYTPSAYRRHNKPAFGPVGDSLDDLQ